MQPLKEAPDDWTPKDSTREWARKNAPDVDFWAEADAMKRHRFSTARTDWDKTLMNWLKRAQENIKPWQKADKPVIRDTYKKPDPRYDKFHCHAMKQLHDISNKTKGRIPEDIRNAMIARKNELVRDFRLLEAEGEPVDHFPRVLLDNLRKIYARR